MDTQTVTPGMDSVTAGRFAADKIPGFRFAVSLTLLIVYNFFFWKEDFGINIVIFSVLYCSLVLFLNGENARRGKAVLMFGAVIYCCIMVIIYNSVFSKFSLIAAIMIFTGFAHRKSLSSVITSLSSYAFSYFFIPLVLVEGYSSGAKKSRPLRVISVIFKLCLIPLILCLIFYGLYSLGNQQFAHYGGIIFDEIFRWLDMIFKDYPVIRFFYIALGLILIIPGIYNKGVENFEKYDADILDNLYRDKSRKLFSTRSGKREIPFLKSVGLLKPKFNSLRNEMKMAVIFLILINIMILGLNVIDIKFLWLNFDPAEITGFSDYVHDGTYVLIFSIVLSMITVLYFFRGNLNFYSKNPLMKYLTYAWMVQNGFMALSVGLRDYYYIVFTHTISYKKIGVMIYLLLALIGIITIILKVYQKRTTYNVLKINSWAAVIVFLVMSSFNWNRDIAEYNLANPVKHNIDVAYLLELGDDVLPELDRNSELLNKEFYIPRSYRIRKSNALDFFNERKLRFMNDYNSHSWLSWNLADQRVYVYFKHQPKE